ncbi:MAG: ATP-binding protein [Methylobacter sp.]
MNSLNTADIEEASVLAQLKNSGESAVVSTILKTDERVIARVTDGIYRQPGSALRELISNAYDADATQVIIKTDAPRFDRITIEDDGHGMGLEALVHLLHHIGGSAKRTQEGASLGVTNANDPLRSPGGRRLIGKIGIGLFSVSQLTHTFQIITKEKGDEHRIIATVALRQYSEEEALRSPEGEKRFESGKVNIWREKALDSESHGTTIILTGIRPQARDTLRSREIWSVIEQAEKSTDAGEHLALTPPRFHIGRMDLNSWDLLKETGGKLDSLPWNKNDSQKEAFRKLVYAVWIEAERSNPNQRLEKIFDYYLQMVWQLALAIPAPYVDGSPYGLDSSNADIFLLSNKPKGSTTPIEVENGKTIQEILDLQQPAGTSTQFDVYVDGLLLQRPIKFRNLPITKNALKKPLMFIGKCREEFSGVPHELSGGPLSFEAYLFWTPKIAPTEHQGSLIRIHGSSGTLFDSSFMKYQVSELTRLRQITCEIFVSEGLDSALNIDRESFNYAHPHSVYITKWLHSALRQLATTQKRIAAEVREKAREQAKDAILNDIQCVVNEVWHRESGDIGSLPPAIEITDTGEKTVEADADAYVFRRSSIIPASKQSISSSSRTTKQNSLETKVKAIAQILASYGLLDAVPQNKLEQLLNAIYRILEASED